MYIILGTHLLGADPSHIFQALSAAFIVKGIITYTYTYTLVLPFTNLSEIKT